MPDLPAAHPSAVVFFGRAEVFLFGAGRSRGVLRERYGGGLLERHGPFHVRRSQWFCMARQGPRPYGPTLNERLSAAHARLMEVAQGGDSSPELKETSASPSSSKEETVTFGRKSVRLYIAWGKVQAVEEEADARMMRESQWFSVSHLVNSSNCFISDDLPVGLRLPHHV